MQLFYLDLNEKKGALIKSILQIRHLCLFMFRIIAISDTLVKSYSYILCEGEGLWLVWGR